MKDECQKVPTIKTVFSSALLCPAKLRVGVQGVSQGGDVRRQGLAALFRIHLREWEWNARELYQGQEWFQKAVQQGHAAAKERLEVTEDVKVWQGI